MFSSFKSETYFLEIISILRYYAVSAKIALINVDVKTLLELRYHNWSLFRDNRGIPQLRYNYNGNPWTCTVRTTCYSRFSYQRGVNAPIGTSVSAQ